MFVSRPSTQRGDLEWRRREHEIQESGAKQKQVTCRRTCKAKSKLEVRFEKRGRDNRHLLSAMVLYNQVSTPMQT